MSRTEKFRGRDRTHGRGRKAGRGAGKSGGKGMSGLWKHKKTWVILNDPDRWGRHGFTRHASLSTDKRCINLDEVVKIAANDGVNEIDLGELGYDKLLGRGSVDRALTITVNSYSQKAKSKIEAADGSILSQ